MNATVESVTDDSFEDDVLKAESPVLVDFWAPWCGPCKILSPTLEEISTENREKIKIVKINIDENQLIAGRYGIKSMPTMMIFEKGELKNQLVGSMPKQEIEKVLFTEI